MQKGRGYRAAATGLGAALGSWALGGLGAAIVAVVFVTEKLDIAGLAGLALLFGLGGVRGPLLYSGGEVAYKKGAQPIPRRPR